MGVGKGLGIEDSAFITPLSSFISPRNLAPLPLSYYIVRVIAPLSAFQHFSFFLPISRLTFHPLTPDRWSDIEQLFGPRGACAGCWCTYWRQSQKEYSANSGAANKRILKKIVSKTVPGIIAYSGDEPIGWCAVRPREEYVRLENSRVLAPVDDQPVWSVTCFSITREFRKQGVSSELLKAAIKHVKKSGGKILEGYPTDVTKKQADAFLWTGTAQAFLNAGFKEVARRSATRPIMRYQISKSAR